VLHQIRPAERTVDALLAWRTNRVTCSFKVVYSDFRGQIHRAICWMYWHRPSVTWDADEIIDYTHETVT